jgi:hypothetical protein
MLIVQLIVYFFAVWGVLSMIVQVANYVMDRKTVLDMAGKQGLEEQLKVLFPSEEDEDDD